MTDRLTIEAKFEGELADGHVVPAYDTISALYAIARGILIPTHYLTEGKVRHRDISSDKYDLFIAPPKEGSVEFPFELLIAAGAIAANHPLVIGTATNLASEFISNSIKRAVGKNDAITSSELQESIDEGTLDAIAAAMEPSLRTGHKIINNGVLNITINSEGGDVTLDNSTKNYLNNFERSNLSNVRLMSVSSFNANSKSGGAFDGDEGRVIPFFLTGKPDPTTLRTIAKSQAAYIEYQISKKDEDKERGFIAVQHYEVHDANHKLKRIQVVKARPLIDDI